MRQSLLTSFVSRPTLLLTRGGVGSARRTTSPLSSFHPPPAGRVSFPGPFICNHNSLVKGFVMGERFWYAGRLNESTTTVYLFDAPSKRFAMDLMRTMCKAPVIEQLTWSRLQKITGCIIPTESNPNEFARGNVICHRKDNCDLVLLVS